MAINVSPFVLPAYELLLVELFTCTKPRTACDFPVTSFKNIIRNFVPNNVGFATNGSLEKVFTTSVC